MSSHCSWQTPLDSNLFPCHGLSGKRSRSSKIMSAAVLEAVSLISKWPCPGISTETDMRQRILCAVQCSLEQYTGLISMVYQRLALAQHEIWLLIRLARVSCQGEWAECRCGAGPCWKLERKLRRHKLGSTSKRTNAVNTAHTVKEKNHNHFAELLRKQAMSK